jgi:hypothetical protein
MTKKNVGAFLTEADKAIDKIRADLLFDEAGDNIPNGPVAIAVVKAVSGLEIARQELKLAIHFLEQEVKE